MFRRHITCGVLHLECRCLDLACLTVLSLAHQPAPAYVQIQLPQEIQDFIHQSTGNYGKVKLVLQRNKFYVESRFPEVLQQLSKVCSK